MSGKKVWTSVGSIRLSEKGKLYIKFHGQKNRDGVFSSASLDTLAKAISDSGEDGLVLQIEKPQEKINRLASLGHIAEEDLERRLDSIPAWLRYEITLPPQDD